MKMPNKSVWMRTGLKVLRARGIFGAPLAASRIFFPARAKTLPACLDLVAGRNGLEIGGPSHGGLGPKGHLPIYPAIAHLDNCNFAANTVWEKSLQEGNSYDFYPGKPKGRQYVAEATDLRMIPDNHYDFVLSNHSLEHTANPLRALAEWVRILKPGGAAILVLPHKAETFDRRRPVTTLEHLIRDFQNNTGEDDLTHLREVLELHDLDLDWGVDDVEQLKQRTENNYQNRCLHHHVFTTSLLVEMCNFADMQVVSAESVRPFHAIVSARKISKGEVLRNEPFLSKEAPWRKASPFKIDRL
jgi:SAM-dependent methyltransferase